MKFDLHSPCSNCPFRTDCPPGWLGEKRATGIAECIDNGDTFACHKTTVSDGETGARRVANHSQHCAGALILLKKEQKGFSGSISLACALRIFDYTRLNLAAPVFNTLAEFIAHHAKRLY